jgi:hypothetical protein
VVQPRSSSRHVAGRQPLDHQAGEARASPQVEAPGEPSHRASRGCHQAVRGAQRTPGRAHRAERIGRWPHGPECAG